MLNALVVYATITGNNEAVADLIIANLQQNNINVTKKEISLCDVQTLLNFDIVVLVPYTYDNGALPEEGLDFYDDLALIKLPDVIYGVTGSGDLFYEDDYCLAVDAFAAALAATGATQGVSNLKLNLYPDDMAKEQIQAFVKQLLVTTTNQ
ncbi:flavodoxin domain-containing protein [Periweissella ghanensis]|uniref:Flavodoxin n=1 Tax=Periweissella ghanensis TaxID=467997 RepID=A0ABM8ZAF6_9LACO|nr:flavodoxin domain-containing protein [Periweissella ghanensis]MCM0600653.1 flavodoxin domain-containing protein [Periweissella ghanensis]CAH0418457.1 Flavodoxin [Periweissella ghanensis]